MDRVEKTVYYLMDEHPTKTLLGLILATTIFVLFLCWLASTFTGDQINLGAADWRCTKTETFPQVISTGKVTSVVVQSRCVQYTENGK